MELVTAMDLATVTLDGLTPTQQEKSVIAQLNVLETAQDMESVNVEFANVTLASNFFLIAHAKTVQPHVAIFKCVPVMEPVLVSQDSLDLTVKQRLIVPKEKIVSHA